MTKNEEAFNEFIKSLGRHRSNGNNVESDVSLALMLLLKANSKSIAEWYVKTNDGAEFHKFFRQCDVTYSGDIDMAIWLLINASEAYTFAWKECKEDA